ncbi:MAG TPA: hypothetical protein HA257_05650 [Candidatus Methanoperedenaceae archaeon]|nr:hypothetical protein [Candidatus Methanoperedenaceae archaeon]
MKIIPIAADSMGTRSMATFVETPDIRILIDPAVSLGPRRYGLPPHPAEYIRMDEHWDSIRKYSSIADVIILTHYHYDHHNPEYPELCEGKTVLIKHPTEHINLSQKKRAGFFLGNIKGIARRVEFADVREFSFGNTLISFSPAVFHGTGGRLGYVVEVSIRSGGECFLFTSDVEGPNTKEQVDFIIRQEPNIVYLDGPLSYMLGYRYSHESLAAAIDNIRKLLAIEQLDKLIIDHHLLRDLKWKERINEVFDTGKAVLTAAQFLGLENDMLEARRKDLFRERPVSNYTYGNTDRRQLEE